MRDFEWVEAPGQDRGDTAGSQELGVSICVPIAAEQAQSIARQMREGRRIIVNLEKAAPEDCQRILDYLEGAAYMGGYHMESISQNAVLLFRGSDEFQVEHNF